MIVSIQPEAPDDYPGIHELNRAAFGQPNEATLVDLLRKSEHYIPELSLIAVSDYQIVGHILFTKIKIISEDGNSSESLALAPMAVKPDLQKQGIGGQLIRQGLKEATKLGFSSVIVLGHEHYYPRFGFVPTVKWNIKPPFEVSLSVFMAIELAPNALTHVSGTVHYPKEFEEVG